MPIYSAFSLAVFAYVRPAIDRPFDHQKKMLYRDVLAIIIVAVFFLLLLASVCLLKYYNRLTARAMLADDDSF